MKYVSVRFLILLALVASAAVPAFAQKTEKVYLDAAIAQSKLKDYKSAHVTLTECVTALPKSTECLYRRALVRELAIGYGLALEDYTTLKAMLPGNTQVLNARGGVLISLKRYDEAIVELTISLALKPDAQGFYDRSRAYMEKKDEVNQLSDLTKSINLKPTKMAYIYRGSIYEKRKDQAGALADYNALIAVAPDYGNGYYLRGKIYFDQGKTDLAEADFAKAIALDPTMKSSVDSTKSLAAIGKMLDQYKNRPKTPLEALNETAYDHVMKKEWDFAIAAYTKSIAMAPADHWGYINRGRAYSGKGDYVKALADINKGMSMLKPASAAGFRVDRAMIYLKQRKFDLAMTEIKAIMADETAPNAYSLILRGKIYAGQGNKTAARADFEQAIKLNKYATEAKDELAKLGN